MLIFSPSIFKDLSNHEIIHARRNRKEKILPNNALSA